MACNIHSMCTTCALTTGPGKLGYHPQTQLLLKTKYYASHFKHTSPSYKLSLISPHKVWFISYTIFLLQVHHMVGSDSQMSLLQNLLGLLVLEPISWMMDFNKVF
ncbi:hypothetical protein CsSME_00002808 [Camellia sinensis var. sinensis]